MYNDIFQVSKTKVQAHEKENERLLIRLSKKLAVLLDLNCAHKRILNQLFSILE
jgi:hypothetical protein